MGMYALQGVQKAQTPEQQKYVVVVVVIVCLIMILQAIN
jgi:hypothetical protein